jgi:hypothetical protein
MGEPTVNLGDLPISVLPSRKNDLPDFQGNVI